MKTSAMTSFLVKLSVKATTSLKKDVIAVISQLTFTCSQSAIETLEKGMKYLES